MRRDKARVKEFIDLSLNFFDLFDLNLNDI